MKRTVEATARWNLCISCGLCRGICPKNCITWEKTGGLYHPVIDREACVDCGLCAEVCPGLGFSYAPSEDALTAVTGPVLASFNAWSRDRDIRHSSASGGCVTTIVRRLLEAGAYDVVFTLSGYDYSEQLLTRPFDAGEFEKDTCLTKTVKSRYLPVSQERAAAYIRENPGKRVIFIGTSCAIQGLSRCIERLRRDREQYLLIGLFCEKIFTANVWDYFAGPDFCGDRKLTALHFKNKESGGWPGNMKLHFGDGTTAYLDKSCRMGAKGYFNPERCLYCVDKLNSRADLSLGDNYTGQDETPLGSNSVILRTNRGMAAWERVCDGLEYVPVTIGQIQKAQAMTDRLRYQAMAQLKEQSILQSEGASVTLNAGIRVEFDEKSVRREWTAALERLRAGAVYPQDPDQLRRRREADHRAANPTGLRRFLRRVKNFVKRKLGI